MLRTTPNRIADDWIMHPQFQIWPPKKHRAILWTLANVIIFRLKQKTNLTLQDYVDLLQRSRWKLMRPEKERELVGNYLTVLEAGGGGGGGGYLSNLVGMFFILKCWGMKGIEMGVKN